MKIWSLPKHENLTTGKKYRGKEEKLLLRSNFSSFPQYFQYISFKSPITHIFVKCGCLNYFFLNSANLICRGMDISKYFRESLGIRDNESRMYFYAPRRISGEHIVAASSVRPCVRASVPLLSTQILGNCLSDFNETSWEY